MDLNGIFLGRLFPSPGNLLQDKKKEINELIKKFDNIAAILWSINLSLEYI